MVPAPLRTTCEAVASNPVQLDSTCARERDLLDVDDREAIQDRLSGVHVDTGLGSQDQLAADHLGGEVIDEILLGSKGQGLVAGVLYKELAGAAEQDALDTGNRSRLRHEMPGAPDAVSRGGRGTAVDVDAADQTCGHQDREC